MKEIQTKYLEQLIREHTRDMSDTIVAITGTTSGTGFVCARELARLGARVLLLNRPSQRAAASFEQLQVEVPGARFEQVACDLQDFASVRAAASEVARRLPHLDVLCNNAGVMAFPDQATKDGYDVQMQTNAIAPFLLTKELFPLLRKSAEARIVNHTSAARLGPDHEPAYFEKKGGQLGGDGSEEESLQFRGPRWARYHQSKLANCTFTYELKARLEQARLTHVKVLLAHPGLAWTGLAASSASTGGMDLQNPLMQNAQSAEDGALGILRACADPAAQSGDFYGPREWTGYASKLEAEELLCSEHNRRIGWEGCEAAVGAFAVD